MGDTRVTDPKVPTPSRVVSSGSKPHDDLRGIVLIFSMKIS